MHCNGMIITWHGLLQALETHFSPSYYDDSQGVLFKLTQKGTISKYLNEFEKLTNESSYNFLVELFYFCIESENSM